MQKSRTFSENWHRVATMRVSLKATVSVRKQIFRGEIWYLIYDPFNNSFFRSRPEAYQFIARLRSNKTVEQVWEECLNKFPDSAPGQEDAISILTQLHHQNLLKYDGSTDSARVFERYEKRRQAEIRSRLMNIMFPRFHLFDPNPMLNRIETLIRWLTSPLSILIWVTTLGYGTKVLLDHFDTLYSNAEGVLAPGNWPLLYIGIVLIKVMHESGHAILCKKFGGDVHSVGLGLIIFTPLPFVDATSSWGFRSRWHRALVGCGGMIVEVFLASLAAIVWARTGEGTVHAVAYNIMWIASISTVFFNMNPLVRFDGYYIVSDIFDIPNLQGRSRQQLIHIIEFYLFGNQDSESPALSRFEAFWLAMYGVASMCYRFILFVAIISFVADKFLIVGLILVVACVVTWFVIPFWEGLTYMVTSPRLARSRARAISVTFLILGTTLSVLSFWPAPRRIRAPGILQPLNQIDVVSESSGIITDLLTPSGSMVTTGTPLVQLKSPDLDFAIREIRAEIVEVQAQTQERKVANSGDLDAVRKRMAFIQTRLATLLARRSKLKVTARLTGKWIDDGLLGIIGAHIARGSFLGRITDETEYRFAAIVTQDEASNLFFDGVTRKDVEVKISGQGHLDAPVMSFTVLGYQQYTLPSVALGWMGGGPVPVIMSDSTGLKTQEPFFEMRSRVQLTPQLQYLAGRRGIMRLTLGKEPLLWQWWRQLRQTVQRRYQI